MVFAFLLARFKQIMEFCCTNNVVTMLCALIWIKLSPDWIPKLLLRLKLLKCHGIHSRPFKASLIAYVSQIVFRKQTWMSSNLKQRWKILVLQEPSLICLSALFMSVGDVTNRMRQVHIEVQYHKLVLYSHSEPPLADLKHSLDSHTPFTTKLKLGLNWGFLN